MSIRKKISLAALLVILGIAIWCWLNTLWGLKATVEAIKLFCPSEISVEHIGGKVSGTMVLENIHFEDSNLALTIKQLEIKISPHKLLIGKTPIRTININNLEIIDKTTGQLESTFTFGKIIASVPSLLIRLALTETLAIKNLILKNSQRQPKIIEQIYLQVKVKNKKIELLKIELGTGDTKIDIQGTKNTLRWQVNIPAIDLFLPKTMGALHSQGNIIYNDKILETKAAMDLVNFAHGEIYLSKITSQMEIEDTQNRKINLDIHVDNLKNHGLILDKISLHAQGQTTVKNKNELKFNIATTKSNLLLPEDSSKKSITLNGIAIDGLINKKGLAAKLHTMINAEEPLIMAIKLPKFRLPLAKAGKQPLLGELHWHSVNLNFLQTIFPQVADIRGALETNLFFTGNLDEPNVRGTINLRNIHLKIPSLNIEPAAINLDIHMQNNGNIICHGSLGNSQEYLNLAGDASFTSNSLRGNLSLEGKNFPLANTKEYKIICSPKLSLKFANNQLVLAGDILLNSATIKPMDFSTYDFLPHELTYKTSKKTAPKVMTRSHITLDLGEQTYIDIMGLNSKIKGFLEISDDPQKTTLANGKITAHNGFYQIYKQKLKILKGELIFLNSPLGNPKIDIVAAKEFLNANQFSFFNNKNQGLQVGAKICGTLAHPETILFSNPPGLSHADILSYLVTGQPLENISENSGKLLLQFATTMNIRDTNDDWLNKFKKKFNFSEFGLVEEIAKVESELKDEKSKKENNSSKNSSFLTNTAFVLGKYLTPKIWVGYSIGLANQTSIFRIKYYFGKYFALRSENNSGGSSAVDLIYTIER